MRLDTVREELRRVLDAALRGSSVPVDPQLFEDVLWFLDLLRKREGINVERPTRRQRRGSFEDPYTTGWSEEFIREHMRRAEAEWKRAFEEGFYRQQQQTAEEINRQQEQSRRREYRYDWGRWDDWERATRAPRPKKQREWYEVLGVRPDSTIPQRQKAYRSLAQRLHPDKPGGSTEKFQELQQAKREAGL